MNNQIKGIVTICGSMKRAWKDILFAKYSFEGAGYIVLVPTDPESSGIFTEKPLLSKDILTKMHRWRISMATKIYICNDLCKQSPHPGIQSPW